MSSICVVLNGYKRPEYLSRQVDSIRGQSIYPNEIFYWQNSLRDVCYDDYCSESLISSRSNHNFGVWSRFAYALNSKSEYICIFDDDTIPGSMWLENCISTYSQYPGLLGTIGLIFNPNNDSSSNVNYVRNCRVGWDAPNEKTVQVDIVGHSWFFHRDLLSVFWRELPDLSQSMSVGEDIHFSYMIQKYTKYKVYVPPHPSENKEMWGSLFGWELGNDARATAGYAIPEMVSTLQKYIQKGFKPICADSANSESDVGQKCLFNSYDHVDIGTCDFEIANGVFEKEKKYLLVEPLKYYLDNIPDGENVIKVNSAVGADNVPLSIFYIEECDIIKYNLPFWVRGCNSIGRKHPVVLDLLKHLNMDNLDIFKEKKVESITFRQLIENYKINYIVNLKVDTEGYDHIIFNDVVDCIMSGKVEIENITLEYRPDLGSVSGIDILYDKISNIYPIREVYGDNIFLYKSKK